MPKARTVSIRIIKPPKGRLTKGKFVEMFKDNQGPYLIHGSDVWHWMNKGKRNPISLADHLT